MTCPQPQEMPKKYRDASTDEVGGPDGWIHHEQQGTVDPLGGLWKKGDWVTFPFRCIFISIFETCLS